MSSPEKKLTKQGVRDLNHPMPKKVAPAGVLAGTQRDATAAAPPAAVSSDAAAIVATAAAATE
jgi:hypothetical protein